MWVKDAPKKDGWYWVHARGQLSGNKYVHPVRVYRNGEAVFSDGDNFSSKNDMFVEWWNEEIKEPES